jgi:hypothetical protein
MISAFSSFAFGIGGLRRGRAGQVADHTGIAFVYQVCALLLAITCSRYSCRSCRETCADADEARAIRQVFINTLLARVRCASFRALDSVLAIFRIINQNWGAYDWCHRPAVSSEGEASVVCLTAQGQSQCVRQVPWLPSGIDVVVDGVGR